MQDDPWAVDFAARSAGAPAPQSAGTGAATDIGTDAATDPVASAFVEAGPATLAAAVLAFDPAQSPVFAVLDGAQFDNLPQDLLLGGFINRALYLDRGDNHPEQIVTAPQMVWLDERPARPDGRAPQQTLAALLALLAGRPAAVFWVCPAGAEALYRHLRGINMVCLPRAALSEADRRAAGAEVEPALFRHADANVLAQILPSVTAPDAARLFGPASALILAADPVWSGAQPVVLARRPGALPRAKEGLWHLSPETLQAMERHREGCLRRKVVQDFAEPRPGTEPAAERRRRVLATFDRALSYGLEEMKDIWALVALDLAYGHGFETRPEFADALRELTDPHQSPAARVHYARLACETVGLT